MKTKRIYYRIIFEPNEKYTYIAEYKIGKFGHWSRFKTIYSFDTDFDNVLNFIKTLPENKVVWSNEDGNRDKNTNQ